MIGPGIGPDSFQVGEEVVRNFKEAGFPIEEIWSFRDMTLPGMAGGHHIDLFRANQWLLSDAGVEETNIQIIGIDTYTAPRFYSARREGIETGKNINAIMLES